MTFRVAAVEIARTIVIAVTIVLIRISRQIDWGCIKHSFRRDLHQLRARRSTTKGKRTWSGHRTTKFVLPWLNKQRSRFRNSLHWNTYFKNTFTQPLLCNHRKIGLPGNDAGDSTAGTSFRLLANDEFKKLMTNSFKMKTCDLDRRRY